MGIAMGVGICEYWCVHGHGYGGVGMGVYEYWFVGMAMGVQVLVYRCGCIGV